MHVHKLTADNFEAEVLTAEVPVMVDFYADWCGPCKMMGPIFEEVASEVTTAKFGKINIDEAMEIAKKYRVMTIPTFIVFKGGEVHKRHSGTMSKDELKSFVE